MQVNVAYGSVIMTRDNQPSEQCWQLHLKALGKPKLTVLCIDLQNVKSYALYYNTCQLKYDLA